MSGCQEEIESLIRETNDSTQLATWCTVYKAELARKRSECHGLTESLRKAKRDLDLTQMKLADQTAELTAASWRISVLEEDITSQVFLSLFSLHFTLVVRAFLTLWRPLWQ